MHPISDKELDKLFQQRFEEAEIEPSEAVWGKICGKMDRQKGVRPFSFFWLAAASVIIVIGAGLWFYRPVEVIRLQGASQVASNNTDELKFPEATEKQGMTTEISQPRSAAFTLAKSAVIDPRNFKLTMEVSPSVSKTETVSDQPITMIASNNSVKKVNTPTQSKQEVKIPARYTGDQSQLDVTQPDMMTKAEIPDQDIAGDEVVSRDHRKIRSIGSLVNFVIAKVDRRNDKIIEFKDGEEGSEVSGINLGLIKFKNKK